MRTVLYSATVAAVAFMVSMAVLAWSGADSETSATIEMAFPEQDLVSTEDISSTEDTFGAAHRHALIEVATDQPIPSVTHLVFPDEMDGYNVQILAENFTFTPSAINLAPVANEGHAHLYINGEKISRVYGNWVHVPANALVSGVNSVSITLNANDHSEWAFDGSAIGSTVIVVKPEPTVVAGG